MAEKERIKTSVTFMVQQLQNKFITNKKHFKLGSHIQVNKITNQSVNNKNSKNHIYTELRVCRVKVT